ncbi:hypothetical protein DPMN_030132, partial [Dreissena polymorpha]
VCAVFGDYRGSPTEAISFMTKTCEPDPPQPPKFDKKSKSSISLKWNNLVSNWKKQRCKSVHLPLGDPDNLDEQPEEDNRRHKTFRQIMSEKENRSGRKSMNVYPMDDEPAITIERTTRTMASPKSKPAVDPLVPKLPEVAPWAKDSSGEDNSHSDSENHQSGDNDIVFSSSDKSSTPNKILSDDESLVKNKSSSNISASKARPLQTQKSQDSVLQKWQNSVNESHRSNENKNRVNVPNSNSIIKIITQAFEVKEKEVQNTPAKSRRSELNNSKTKSLDLNCSKFASYEPTPLSPTTPQALLPREQRFGHYRSVSDPYLRETDQGTQRSRQQEKVALGEAHKEILDPRTHIDHRVINRCGKQVKDADDVEFQPTKKEHSSFAESRVDVKPLMGEEKRQQLANDDTKTRLREMCVTYGRTSENVQEFCKIICERFLQVHGVINSYPAYTIGNETNIVFVLTIKDNINDIHQQLAKFDIDTIIKTVSSAICEDDLAITEDFRENCNDMERLNECILNNTEDLMQQHKYLNVIRGGSNKQMKGSKRGLCIVLYVHAKGFIPIDEDPFKKSYDGIHVKILEGRFTPYMNHGEEIRQGSFAPYMNRADVVLNKLKMGCKIEGHNNGTLGVFIEHPSYGMCGITCAHVAISATEMEECKSENGRLLWQKIDPSKKYIHQPSRINDDLNQFGQIVEVIYKEGKGSETGIEIALIQIEKRHPDSGKFPTSRSDSVESDFEFVSGKTCGPTRFNTNNRCFKVGSATGFTEGTVEMCAPNTVRTDKHKWDYDHLRITLYNQIFIRPIREDFAVQGDSGSPVFVKEEGTGEPVCIGLVEGGLTGGLVVVTPITQILEELGISQLKAFPQNVMQDLQQIKQQQLQIQSTLNVLTTQYAEVQQIKSTLNVFQAQYEELIKEIRQHNRTHTT